MIKEFTDFVTGGLFKVADEEVLKTYSTSKPIELYTFIWSRNGEVTVEIDGIQDVIKQDTIVVLTPNQYFRYVSGTGSVVYQFNREFYCIKDHDKEVSCVGVLFFSVDTITKIKLEPKDADKLDALHTIFLDELDTVDTIQSEMLQILLSRLIITSTRLIKQQSDFKHVSDQIDLIRNFNILVDTHFRKEHSVGFYADQLFKSPKTLSNSFSKYKKSPLQIIHDRIILEAKRLLMYTDKSAKEIAYELGFEDASHLSRMFKKHTSYSPSEFKKQLRLSFSAN